VLRGLLACGLQRQSLFCVSVLRLFTLLFSVVVLLSSSIPAQQQLTEEEKKRLFLKAREEMTTIPFTPPAQPTVAPKPKPRTIPPEPVAPVVKPPTPVPTPAPAPQPPPSATPPPVKTVVPPLRPPEETKAPIVVRETGVAEADEKDEGQPKEEGFWSRVFGSGASYKYLSPSVRRAIDKASVRKGRWRYIVVHNSGTRQGSAKAFEHYHRYVRRMPNGMAYHFVIGNGTSSGNGAIEIGNRWHRQIQGGHVHSDYLNNIALGICFVGDFNNGRPTKVQLEAAEELVGYLRKRVGRVSGQRAAVRPHKAINPPRWPTDCPGDDFPYTWFRNF
jgi:hypothetical protein